MTGFEDYISNILLLQIISVPKIKSDFQLYKITRLQKF